MEPTPQSEHERDQQLPTSPELQQPLVSQLAPPATHAMEADKQPVAQRRGPLSETHAEFANDTHEYIRDFIRNADQKAAFFFAALTAILAFLNAQNVPARWLKDVRQWSFVDALGFVSMLGLAAGAAVLLSVVFPRLKGSRRGLLYFNAIAEYDSSSEYADDVIGRSPDGLVRTKLQHCYDLSQVCHAKYRTLRVGFWIGSVGTATALLFLVLSKV